MLLLTFTLGERLNFLHICFSILSLSAFAIDDAFLLEIVALVNNEVPTADLAGSDADELALPLTVLLNIPLHPLIELLLLLLESRLVLLICLSYALIQIF